MRGRASLATSDSMRGSMALDPSIPLSSAPKFNTPFEVLGQLGQIRAMRQNEQVRAQQIRSNQATEEDRRYKLAENKQNDEDTLALVQLMAANPTATQAQMKSLVAQRVPRMLQKYLDVADKHEKEVAAVAKDVTESMTKAQNYLANDAQDTLSAPEAARPAVFRQKLETQEKLFPFMAPHFAQLRQRLDGGEDVTALLQGAVRSDPAARNAETTATTAAAELPGRQATSAMSQRVLAGSTPTGITAEQQAANALQGRSVAAAEQNARTAAARETRESTPTSASDVTQSIRTTASGRKYVDLSDWQTPKERSAAQRAALVAGVVPVNKDAALGLTAADTARANLQSMLAQIQGKLPKDPTGRIIAGPKNIIQKFVQSDTDLAAWGSWRTAAIQAVQALAERGMGLRLNRSEIDLMLQNDIPQITDTWDVAQQRVKNLLTLLDHKEESILVHNRSSLSAGPKVGDERTANGETRRWDGTAWRLK